MRRIVKSLVFFGALVYALSSWMVVLTIFYGITAGAVLAAVFGYIVGTYLFYYGVFVEEEPSLKEKMKEEGTRKAETSEV